MNTSSKTPLVGIVMGSASDWDVMQRATSTLADFGVAYEARVLSAHRTPEETAEWAKTAEQRGLRVLIAAAGGAAHLAGVVAAVFSSVNISNVLSLYCPPVPYIM